MITSPAVCVATAVVYQTMVRISALTKQPWWLIGKKKMFAKLLWIRSLGGSFSKALNSFVRKNSGGSRCERDNTWKHFLTILSEIPPRAAGVCLLGSNSACWHLCGERFIYFFIAANAYILFYGLQCANLRSLSFHSVLHTGANLHGSRRWYRFLCSLCETCPTLTARLSAVISEPKPLF